MFRLCIFLVEFNVNNAKKLSSYLKGDVSWKMLNEMINVYSDSHTISLNRNYTISESLRQVAHNSYNEFLKCYLYMIILNGSMT